MNLSGGGCFLCAFASEVKDLVYTLLMELVFVNLIHKILRNMNIQKATQMLHNKLLIHENAEETTRVSI